MKDKMLNELMETFQIYFEYSKKEFNSKYKDLNINEVHTIYYVGHNENANVTHITNYLKITKGAVTKITKKLIDGGYLTTYQLDQNRKEKYFELTQKGRDLFNKHEKIHNETFKEDLKIFDSFNKEENEIISDFIGKLKEMYVGKLEKLGD